MSRWWGVISIMLLGFAHGSHGALDPNLYLAIGDGITYGSVYDITPWPERLDSLLGSGKTVINAAKSGSRVGYASSKINEWLAYYDPGYLLILYGTNDLGIGNDIDYIIGQLRAIIQAAKANHTVPVLGTLPPIFNGLGSGQSTLNARIRQLAAEEDIECADVSAAFNYDSGLMMDDGLHPNSQGQQLIATTFRNAIWASPEPIHFSLSPDSVQVPDTGSTGAGFTVESDSSWWVTASVPWITAVTGTGTGNGTVLYNIAPNYGNERTGTIQVTSDGKVQTFTVTQMAATLDVVPETTCVPSGGATGLSIDVTAHLPWTAVANDSWITLRSGISGTGNGTIRYDIASNSGIVRTGTITVTVGGVTRCRAVVNQWPEPVVAGMSTESDFDGDGIADAATFQPVTGEWEIRFSNGVVWRVPWGWAEAKPVPADYDGDGIIDFAVYHPASGNWYILQSSNGQGRVESFGWSAAFPLPGDYDGDGRADLAVFYQPTAMWYFRYSTGEADQSFAFGWSAVVPAPADYDGDGVTDVAVYHPSSGNWYCYHSSEDVVDVASWGWSAAVPVAADYDGDGVADIAVFYRATGTWYIRFSGGGSWTQPWGGLGVAPVAADYDGDGLADISVYYSTGGSRYTLESMTGNNAVATMGGAGCEQVLINGLVHDWYGLP